MSTQAQIETEQEAKDIIFDFWQKTILSPAHILYIYDKDFRENKRCLHKWQSKIHTEYLNKEYTSEMPLELCIQAVNGSGKDLFVIALFEAFFMMRYKDGTCITTSASGTQLKNQTEKYIRALCEKINNYHQMMIFEIKERDIKCTITNTQLFLFATDEAGKAEGYHPAGPDKPFAIIINEAKSIVSEIFEALTRCTGFQYWIEVSSPGKPIGHFYQMCSSNRTSINKDGIVSNAVKYVRVTSDDCPHLGSNYKSRIAELYGINHTLYKSMVECEFCSEDENVVLSYEKYNRAIKFQAEWYRDTNGNSAGLDLSGGGDEQALYIRNGNRIIGFKTWREKDANVLVSRLIDAFNHFNLKDRIIYADAGNMGMTIIQLLHNKGWKNIRPIYNQSNPKNSVSYKNLGTEMWFELANLFENNELCFDECIVRDTTLQKQLCGRYFKFTTDNQSHLEPKPQARAKGHPSPDRADALALCFLNYKTPRIASVKDKEKKARQDYEDSKLIKLPLIRSFVEASGKEMKNNIAYNYSNRESFDDNKSDLLKEIKQILNNSNN